MSSTPLIVVGVGMYGDGAAPNVGYTNESDGATPLFHVGIFSGAYSDCHLSLLNSLCTRRGMSLTDRLEWDGGLFLDSASTLFFGGGRSRSGELPKDNSLSAAASLSSGWIGSLPLFCLTGGAWRLLPCAFSTRSSSRRPRRRLFSCCRWSTRLCNSSIRLACSSCFVSISRRQRRNWSSRDWFNGLLAIATGSEKLDE